MALNTELINLYCQFSAAGDFTVQGTFAMPGNTFGCHSEVGDDPGRQLNILHSQESPPQRRITHPDMSAELRWKISDLYGYK